MDTIRILVVGDDPLARAGLATLLSSQPRCQVMGQVSADTDLTASVEVYLPDVVLYDFGNRVIHNQTAIPAATPSVALVNSADDAAMAWSAGARGVLTRDADPGRIVAACNAVIEGLAAVDQVFTAAVFSSRLNSGSPSTTDLTNREMQVLSLMAKGQPNKEIARQLGISEHTVKFHVNSILSKLNASSRTEAVVAATRLGLVLL